MTVITTANHQNIRYHLSGTMGYLRDAEDIADRKWVLKHFKEDVEAASEFEARQKAKKITEKWVSSNKLFDPRFTPKSEQVVFAFDFNLQKSFSCWSSKIEITSSK
jgi:hypothetical protein